MPAHRNPYSGTTYKRAITCTNGSSDELTHPNAGADATRNTARGIDARTFNSTNHSSF